VSTRPPPPVQARAAIADNDGWTGGFPEGKGVNLRRRGRLCLAVLGLAWGVAPAQAAAQPAEPEASLAGDPAPAPPAAPAAAPESPLEQAWFGPADSLPQRVRRTRRAAVELGVWSFDSAARAVHDTGSRGAEIEHAAAAVELAPDLPAAQMRLSQALWLHGESPVDALRVAIAAIDGIPRHLEASLWFAGTGLMIAAVGLLAGGLLCIAAAGLFAAPHAAHDLGDAISGQMPAFARAAFLASLLLLMPLLGEGLLGLALGLLAVGVVYGRPGGRVVLALAAAAVVAGAFPVARIAGSTLLAFAADPVLDAAISSTRGIAQPVDLARLGAAAPEDPLAARALAMQARRSGRLGEADARYQALLASDPMDPTLANNAANVRLSLGHMESALSLYDRSLDLAESPLVLFNLAQAYGRAFQVDSLARTLERAQALDGAAVAELTQLQGATPEGFVVDLPIPDRLVWKRVLASDAGLAVAAELRRPLAPGHLGRDATGLSIVFAAVIAVASAFGARVSPSRWCARCAGRICPRCHPESRGNDACETCKTLFYQPETTDRALRLERITALRARERRRERLATIVSIAVPASAGLLARRPTLSLLGALFFAFAACAVVWRQGVVPDPLIAGAAAPVAFLGGAVLAALAYAIVVGAALATRRRL
jgi:tetratricopeptide (TPR) repeat protein